MERLEKIKADFNFTADDEERLRSLAPVMEECADEFVLHLHRELKETKDQLIQKKLQTFKLSKSHKLWFVRMFSGEYDKSYYQFLTNIGKTHAKMGIRTHYINVSMNIIRDYMMDLLFELFPDRNERVLYRKAFQKVLGINIDIITGAYLEEEINFYSAAYRVKSYLITFAERFSGAMNMILVILLIFLTLGVVGLFFYDFAKILSEGISHSFISALGSLLILWVMIELMETEIGHLKGGKFKISVFIGVALVSFIRDLMVANLEHKAIEKSYYLAGVTLVLGFVYWLIKRTEDKENPRERN